jgi:hypothetical protein
MRAVIFSIALLAGAASAVAQPAEASLSTGGVIEGPFRVDDYGDVSHEDRDRVRDLLRSLKLIAPDADMSSLEGRSVTPPGPEVTTTPDLSVTRTRDLVTNELGLALEAGSEDWPGVGPACRIACDTLVSLAEGLCVAWFKGGASTLCLAGSSAGSEACTMSCPE